MQIPILAIQETGLKESEQLALQRFAEGKGYRAYAASAVLRQQAHGGVMLLVHKTCRSTLILDISPEECQVGSMPEKRHLVIDSCLSSAAAVVSFLLSPDPGGMQTLASITDRRQNQSRIVRIPGERRN